MGRLAKKGDAIPWKINGDHFTVEPATGNIATKESFGDCQLHVEWRIPVNEVHENLRYGNSGVLLMGHYEVQIYSSFKNQHKIYYNGQAGSIYKQFPPLVNASLPEEEWQTFDIVFIAPTFNTDSSLKSPARLTVFHNGVLIQYHVPLKGWTNNTDFTEYKWHPEKLPLVLQEHISRISFRNIWIRKLDMVNFNKKTIKMDKHSTTPDIILKAEDVQWTTFTLPGWTGTTTASFPNMDVEKAPFIAMARLEPDANIQRHMK